MTFPLPGALTRGASNPILTNVGGTYDDIKCGPNQAVKVAAGDYRLWYEGVKDVVGTDEENTVCYATSTDGTNWTKYGSNPIMSGGVAWEVNEVCPTSVIRVSSSDYRMWYHGGNNSGPRQIGYATSSDGLSWSKDAGNPVMTPGAGGSWDESDVADCKVIRVSPSDYRLWYRGTNASVQVRIGYATSTDGISWTKYGSNPVFSPGTSGQWDDEEIHAFSPYMSATNEFHAWYVAHGGDATATSIGYAYSTDGISWTRGANNPVLGPITGELPHDSLSVYKDEGNYRIIYGDYNLSIGQRGLATAILADQSGVAMWVKT